MARIAVISYSDLSRDSRLDRQIGFLRGDHDVVACGLGPPLHAGVEFVDLRPEGTVAGPVTYARQLKGLARLATRRHRATYWRNADIRRIFHRLRALEFDAVVANEVSALPMAVRVAAGRPVIFDAHEWAIEEQAEKRWWRLLMAPYVDTLLRDAAPAIAGAMTVSPGIASLYRERYGIECALVTNAPPEAALEPSAVGETIGMVHHGIAERARRLEVMAAGVAAAGEPWALDLMLVGGDAAYLQRVTSTTADLPNVQVVEPVSPREITRTINAYDVGVYLLRDRQVNQRLALPNKFFEFVQARLAVVVGPSPEMASLVRRYGFGVVADDFTAEALQRALSGLTREDIERMKLAAHRAAPLLSASANEEVVRGLVRNALAGASGRPPA